MQNLNKFSTKSYSKDQRDSNVEPERHIGLPSGYPYTYESNLNQKKPGFGQEPETAGIEQAQYDSHFKHLKVQEV